MFLVTPVIQCGSRPSLVTENFALKTDALKLSYKMAYRINLSTNSCLNHRLHQFKCQTSCYQNQFPKTKKETDVHILGYATGPS